MDEIVRAALQKWPNVPHVYGWLALDARGEWWLRDAGAQAAGPFPSVRGSRIEHERLKSFIGRNYDADEGGCWYFQNGPQRVYVTLEATPWVWRLAPGDGGVPEVVAHTGVPARTTSAWMDDEGRLYLTTDLGFGLVHTLDMEIAADAIEAGRWTPIVVRGQELEPRFGFVRVPAPA
ncbi:MAG TPA: DUF2946 family protein [Caldimonas sp.]|nr:DUF2946 family protein [Caldimonas sp.]